MQAKPRSVSFNLRIEMPSNLGALVVTSDFTLSSPLASCAILLSFCSAVSEGIHIPLRLHVAFLLAVRAIDCHQTLAASTASFEVVLEWANLVSCVFNGRSAFNLALG